MCTQLAAKLFRKTNTNQNSTDLQPPAVSPPELSDFIFFTSFTSKPNLFYLLPKVVAVTAVGMTQFLVQIKVVIVEKWAGHRKRTDQSLPL